MVDILYMFLLYLFCVLFAYSLGLCGRQTNKRQQFWLISLFCFMVYFIRVTFQRYICFSWFSRLSFGDIKRDPFILCRLFAQQCVTSVIHLIIVESIWLGNCSLLCGIHSLQYNISCTGYTIKCMFMHTFMRFIMSKQFCLFCYDKTFLYFSQYCCCSSQSSLNHAVFGYFSANMPGHGRVPNLCWLDFHLAFCANILSGLTEGRPLSHKQHHRSAWRRRLVCVGRCLQNQSDIVFVRVDKLYV